MSDLKNNPPLTARKLAELLLSLHNPDAPVFGIVFGTFWEITNVAGQFNHGGEPFSLIAIEMGRCSSADVDKAAKGGGGMNPSNSTPLPLARPYSGVPITDDMKRLFCQWGGTPKGVAADPSFGIIVQFEEGFQLTFVPVGGAQPVGFNVASLLTKGG